MAKNKIKISGKNKKALRGLSWAVIYGTHIYMLIAGLPQEQIIGHSIMNLVAAFILFNLK